MLFLFKIVKLIVVQLIFKRRKHLQQFDLDILKL